MTELTANRTLVKSHPELWAECSDAASLARHLGQFGEIKITRLEPETAVAWEGDRASGTVRLEPSGWGTKVMLTARVGPAVEEEEEAPAVEEPVAQEPPVEVPAVDAIPSDEAPEEPAIAVAPDDAAPGPERRPGLFARFAARFRRPADAPAEEPPELEAVAPPVEELVPVAEEPVAPAAEEPEAPALEEPPPVDPVVPQAEAALAAALDSLGQAHHRPYSRA